MGGGRAEATVARCSPLYVVIVPKKETLHVGLVVVDDADPGRVVNHVAGRSVEEVRRSVAQPCTAAPRRVRGHASPEAHGAQRRRSGEQLEPGHAERENPQKSTKCADRQGRMWAGCSPDTQRKPRRKEKETPATNMCRQEGAHGPDAAQTHRKKNSRYKNVPAGKAHEPPQNVPTGRGGLGRMQPRHTERNTQKETPGTNMCSQGRGGCGPDLSTRKRARA